MDFTPAQLDLINAPFDHHIALTGPAGSGKTKAAVERLRFMAGSGIPAQSILILVPQRSLGLPYLHQVHAPDFAAGGEPAVVTFGGIAQRMLNLFWPIIAREAGFAQYNRPPQFLTLESAQYFMSQVVAPKFQRGYFESISVDPNRLYSQILDNMNKAAIVGFPIQDFGEKLKTAWVGSPSQLLVYDQAQECALDFRSFCLHNNLLDFSLQFEVFAKHLWPSYICQQYLVKRYRHLVYDNVEEDYPLAHKLVTEWLPHFDSALLISDTEGGFRSFLGADPISASSLVTSLPIQIQFNQSFVQSVQISAFEENLGARLQNSRAVHHQNVLWKNAFEVQSFRFYPEMITWTAESIRKILDEGKALAGEIVILTPFLSDSLRFSFFDYFQKMGIPIQTFRPSRSLKDEPAARTMITLARIAFPEWNFLPTKHDVRLALLHTIAGIDLVRADLLAQMLYSPVKKEFPLASFSQVRPEMQSRITYLIGEKYTQLKAWLEEYQNQKTLELDIFFSRLFGELLSQKGFSYHENNESAAVAARLIESARKFRRSVLSENIPQQTPLAKEYLQVLDQGLIAAQSVIGWEIQSQSDAVLLSPAFTFLMSNRPVKYQFWLDVGSQGWWTRLDQPLTQPYVLSRNWQPGSLWTAASEFAVNQANLKRLTTGLLRRCSEKVFLEIAGMNEQGNEERSELVITLQSLLRAIATEEDSSHV